MVGKLGSARGGISGNLGVGTPGIILAICANAYSSSFNAALIAVITALKGANINCDTCCMIPFAKLIKSFKKFVKPPRNFAGFWNISIRLVITVPNKMFLKKSRIISKIDLAGFRSFSNFSTSFLPSSDFSSSASLSLNPAVSSFFAASRAACCSISSFF